MAWMAASSPPAILLCCLLPVYASPLAAVSPESPAVATAAAVAPTAPRLWARRRRRCSRSPLCWSSAALVFPALSPALSGSFFCSSFSLLRAVPSAATALVDYWLRSPSLDSWFCFLGF